MLTKSYSRTGKVCRVTFRLPVEVDADQATLCGEFNEWDAAAHPMKQLKNGSFSAMVSLPAGKSYRYRYLAWTANVGKMIGRRTPMPLMSSAAEDSVVVV